MPSCGRLQENVREIVEGASSSEKVEVSLEEMTLVNAIIFGYDDTVYDMAVIIGNEGILQILENK